MNKKGFTLIELLATVTILTIIATITVPLVVERINKFKDDSFNLMVSSIENATNKYIVDNRENLDELDTFGYMDIKISELVSSGFLDENIENPKTKEAISFEDVVYASLDYQNNIEVIYDPYQNDNPKITLIGPKNLKIKLGSTYSELGALAIDKSGVDISAQIVKTGVVNASVEDVYTIQYYVNGSIVLNRYVTVTSDFPKDDIEKPVLSSNVSNNYIETTKGVAITMPVVSAIDNFDGTISPISVTSNNLNINATGTYYIKYNYTDSSGNKADTLNVKVIVKP